MSEGPPPSLSVGELRKEREPHRADIFLQKVEKGEEFYISDEKKTFIADPGSLGGHNYKIKKLYE